MDANTDQLLLLGVRKAGSGSKPHLANLAHQVLLLLGTENVSAGTSKHSAVQKLHQRLAEKFNLANFQAMTHYTGGALRPPSERRVRSLSPVLAQKVGKASMGIIDETLTRCVRGVSTASNVTVEVVVGARLKDQTDFRQLLQDPTLTGKKRLVCELLAQQGAELSSAHLAPISSAGLENVAVPSSAPRPKLAKATASSSKGSGGNASTTSQPSTASKVFSSSRVFPVPCLVPCFTRAFFQRARLDD